MTVRIVIALEIPDNDALLEQLVDGDDVIEACTPDEIGGLWLEYASGFHITSTARFELVAVEQLAQR